MTLDITWQKLIKWGGNTLFFLFILVVILDPTATVLSLKSKTFVLLVAYNAIFLRPSFRFLPHIIAVYVAVVVAYIIGMLQQQPCEMSDFVDTALAFSPLLLLLWVHHYNLVTLSLVPAVLVTLIVIGIFIASSISPMYEGAIFYFMKDHNDMVMMTHRYLMGIKVFGIYYKSFVCLVMPLFFFYYKLMNATRRVHWFYLLPATIMTVAFFFSGTRATMLLPFFLIGVVSYKRVASMKQMRYVLYPLIGFGAILFLGLVLILASEKGEMSNTIKFGHLISYKELFDQNPLTFIFGQGLHTRFYSAGFHKLTYETEWTYIELVRCYGIFSLLILFTILYPLVRMARFWRNNYAMGIMLSYVAYLLIAGTNPLLVSSSGMLVVLTAYGCLCRLEREQQTRKEGIV